MAVRFWAEVERLLVERIIDSGMPLQVGTESLSSALISAQRILGYRLHVTPRAVKTRERAMEKAREIWAKDVDRKLSPEEIANSISDLAGARVLVVGISDIHHVHRFICSPATCPSRMKIVASAREFLSSPRDSGWRGLVQSMSVEVGDGSEWPFELQILTYLQHSWDQLQHVVYEESRRPGGSVSGEVVAAFKRMSDSLHQSDLEMDVVRVRMHSQGISRGS
jgi:ppGpp synthetase/RelA/SpoT-type nucleotidyltranferase